MLAVRKYIITYSAVEQVLRRVQLNSFKKLVVN